MEREFGALKGLMGVNGLSGVDIMPDIGIGTGVNVCSDIALVGSCAESCKPGCASRCKEGCANCSKNGGHA
jgi:hypothetical protein